MPEPKLNPQFDFSGGHLALDFANTVSRRPTPERLDRLPHYRDLVDFGEQTGVLSQLDADRLYRKSGASPSLGEAALRQAVQLREALFAIFSAVAERRAVPTNALALLNFAVQESAAHARIVRADRGFVAEWIDLGIDPESPLWPIARAAADLLTSGELANLRICASERCAWLFLDHTKNHRRRWCDMKTCGNRVKARRHYERMKRA